MSNGELLHPYRELVPGPAQPYVLSENANRLAVVLVVVNHCCIWLSFSLSIRSCMAFSANGHTAAQPSERRMEHMSTQILQHNADTPLIRSSLWTQRMSIMAE